MFARFDENPAMNLQDIKETKRYGRTDARTHGQRENIIPPTNKVCGGYNKSNSTNLKLKLERKLEIRRNHSSHKYISPKCALVKELTYGHKNVETLFSYTIRDCFRVLFFEERICSFWGRILSFKSIVPILKRGTFEENHCPFQ